MSKANAKRLTFHEKNQTDCNSGRPYIMLNSSVGSDVEPVEKKKKRLVYGKLSFGLSCLVARFNQITCSIS